MHLKMFGIRKELSEVLVESPGCSELQEKGGELFEIREETGGRLCSRSAHFVSTSLAMQLYQ